VLAGLATLNARGIKDDEEVDSGSSVTAGMDMVASPLACEPGEEKITPNMMKKPHSGNPGFRKMGLAQITAALLAASFLVVQF
jgi:hypothetical protein